MNDLIMIVEDDPYISHFLQMSFEQEGYINDNKGS